MKWPYWVPQLLMLDNVGLVFLKPRLSMSMEMNIRILREARKVMGKKKDGVSNFKIIRNGRQKKINLGP